MLTADGQAEDIVDKGGVVKAVLRHRGTDTSEVQRPGLHLLHDPLASLFQNVDFDARILAGKFHDQLAHVADPRNRRESNEDLPLVATLVGVGGLCDAVILIDDPHRFL